MSFCVISTYKLPISANTMNFLCLHLDKLGSKRPSSRMEQTGSPSPLSKKQRLQDSKRSASPADIIMEEHQRSGSPSSRSGTPTSGNDGTSITEEAIRRYLSHKPMTTTDLVRKFKTKKTGLTKEQTVTAIAAVLKRIGTNQEKIDGKLYLSLKTKK